MRCYVSFMQGHVGLYWRGGRLLHRMSAPGIRLKLPLIDQFETIQVTMQTDKVEDIPCGTKGGVNIAFEKIEVCTPSHDVPYRILAR